MSTMPRTNANPDGDPTGPKRCRYGDVLDLLEREGQTRTSAKTAASA